MSYGWCAEELWLVAKELWLVAKELWLVEKELWLVDKELERDGACTGELHHRAAAFMIIDTTTRQTGLRQTHYYS